MSATAPLQPGAGSPEGPRDWQVRSARFKDALAIAAGVHELLVELGGTPPEAAAMEAATRALLEECDAGAIFVAEAAGKLVGVLAASWQTAIHVPGRYALIQDLWVAPSWRGKTVGAELLAALFALAREQEVACVEVGLPRERFAGLAATQAFYRVNGFAPLSARMRHTLR